MSAVSQLVNRKAYTRLDELVKTFIIMSSFKPKIGDGHPVLPQARVKTIMKSSPDTENISTEALYFVSKATEFFVEHLIQEIHKKGSHKSEISYSGLANVVQTNDSMEFLKEMVPRKITFKEYKEVMEKEKNNMDFY